jgi:transcriptional regulator with XRE-family HTH domain
MTEQIKQIAERIKSLREIEGVSSNALALELGLSEELYADFESGTVDIPVSFLYKIAHRFNFELSALLSGENPKLHVYCVIRKGKGLKVERRKNYQYESLAYNFINKRAEPFIVIAESDDIPYQFNSHPGQEFNYVMEGSVTINIDGREIIMNEGDSIYFDSGYKHALKAMGGKSAKFLAVII